MGGLKSKVQRRSIQNVSLYGGTVYYDGECYWPSDFRSCMVGPCCYWRTHLHCLHVHQVEVRRRQRQRWWDQSQGGRSKPGHHGLHKRTEGPCSSLNCVNLSWYWLHSHVRLN